MGHAMRRAAAGLGFSPLQVGWRNAWWAEGPRFTALGLSDAAAVSTWPDEIGSEDLTQSGSARPTYRSAGTINSKPTVRGNGTQQYLNRTAASFSILSQPDTVVMVAKYATLSNTPDPYLIDGAGSTRQIITGKDGGTNTQWLAFAGSIVRGAGSNTSAHLLLGYFNGASSKMDVDGTQTATGNFGSNNLDGLALFTNSTFNYFASADIAFVGLYSGDARTDTKWSDFKAYCLSHWGITVA